MSKVQDVHLQHDPSLSSAEYHVPCQKLHRGMEINMPSMPALELLALRPPDNVLAALLQMLHHPSLSNTCHRHAPDLAHIRGSCQTLLALAACCLSSRRACYASQV